MPDRRLTTDDVPCLALRPKDAAKALGIGVRMHLQITADRTTGIPHMRFGRAVVNPVRELQDWLSEQAAQPRSEKKR